MTNEEAIIDIRENIQPIVGGKSLDIAISALEKQIQIKPIPHIVNAEKIKMGNGYWGKGTTIYYCPNCGAKMDGKDGE